MKAPQTQRYPSCICTLADLYQRVCWSNRRAVVVPAVQAETGDPTLGVLIGLEPGALGWVLENFQSTAKRP